MGYGGLEPLPEGRDLQSRCRIRTTFISHLFCQRTRIELAPAGLSPALVTIPLTPKTISIGTTIPNTHRISCVVITIVVMNHFHPTIFVFRSGIEPLPFPCKRNTLPLRQRNRWLHIL